MSSELWVVKIGGSLHEAPELKHWLHALALAGGRRLIVVPGGGPFADQVRAAQKREGFDDVSAHHQAVRAMEQYGRTLAGMQPGIQPASSDRELRDVLDGGQVPVWMPVSMINAAADIHCDWETSSDSLAAWLTVRLGTKHLALIKSAVPRPGRWPASQLATEGIVDRHFHDHLQRGRFQTWWLGRDDYRYFADYINAERQPLAEIVSG